VDGQTPESWSGILAQFADANIYQTWAYGAVRWGPRNLSHLVVRREGQTVAAAQMRIVRLPLVPAGIAYLRWGPMCQLTGSVLDPSLVVEVVSALRQEYVERAAWRSKSFLTLSLAPTELLSFDRPSAGQDCIPNSHLGATKRFSWT